MARIACIATKKDPSGNITHVTIDVKKHRETIMPVLEKLGVIKNTAVQKENEDEKWYSVEEARALSLKHIDELWSR